MCVFFKSRCFVLVTAVLILMAAYFEKSPKTGKPTSQIDGSHLSHDSISAGQLNSYHEIRTNRSNLPSVINDHIQVLPQQPISHSELPLFQRLVRCFNIRVNFSSIVSTYSPPSALPVINAFKSVGCIMILYFHLIWYSLYTINNATEVFALGEQLQWQWLSTSPLVVDIFFIIR